MYRLFVLLPEQPGIARFVPVPSRRKTLRLNEVGELCRELQRYQ
jgi:hypothetical protein